MHGPSRATRSSSALLRALGSGLLILTAAAALARAELVVFSDGRVVKATSHQAVGDAVEIRLPGGGSYSVDRSRVDRIVEDEVAGADVQPPPQQPRHVEPARPARVAAQPVEFQDQSKLRQASEENGQKNEKRGHGGGSKAKRGKSGR
jgi:hypothetical protein